MAGIDFPPRDDKRKPRKSFDATLSISPEQDSIDGSGASPENNKEAVLSALGRFEQSWGKADELYAKFLEGSDPSAWENFKSYMLERQAEIEVIRDLAKADPALSSTLEPLIRSVGKSFGKFGKLGTALRGQQTKEDPQIFGNIKAGVDDLVAAAPKAPKSDYQKAREKSGGTSTGRGSRGGAPKDKAETVSPTVDAAEAASEPAAPEVVASPVDAERQAALKEELKARRAARTKKVPDALFSASVPAEKLLSTEDSPYRALGAVDAYGEPNIHITLPTGERIPFTPERGSGFTPSLVNWTHGSMNEVPPDATHAETARALAESVKKLSVPERLQKWAEGADSDKQFYVENKELHERAAAAKDAYFEAMRKFQRGRSATGAIWERLGFKKANENEGDARTRELKKMWIESNMAIATARLNSAAARFDERGAADKRHKGLSREEISTTQFAKENARNQKNTEEWDKLTLVEQIALSKKNGQFGPKVSHRERGAEAVLARFQRRYVLKDAVVTAAKEEAAMRAEALSSRDKSVLEGFYKGYKNLPPEARFLITTVGYGVGAVGTVAGIAAGSAAIIAVAPIALAGAYGVFLRGKATIMARKAITGEKTGRSAEEVARVRAIQAELEQKAASKTLSGIAALVTGWGTKKLQAEKRGEAGEALRTDAKGNVNASGIGDLRTDGEFDKLYASLLRAHATLKQADAQVASASFVGGAVGGAALGALEGATANALFGNHEGAIPDVTHAQMKIIAEGKLDPAYHGPAVTVDDIKEALARHPAPTPAEAAPAVVVSDGSQPSVSAEGVSIATGREPITTPDGVTIEQGGVAPAQPATPAEAVSAPAPAPAEAPVAAAPASAPVAEAAPVAAGPHVEPTQPDGLMMSASVDPGEGFGELVQDFKLSFKAQFPGVDSPSPALEHLLRTNPNELAHELLAAKDGTSLIMHKGDTLIVDNDQNVWFQQSGKEPQLVLENDPTAPGGFVKHEIHGPMQADAVRVEAPVAGTAPAAPAPEGVSITDGTAPIVTPEGVTIEQGGLVPEQAAAPAEVSAPLERVVPAPQGQGLQFTERPTEAPAAPAPAPEQAVVASEPAPAPAEAPRVVPEAPVEVPHTPAAMLGEASFINDRGLEITPSKPEVYFAPAPGGGEIAYMYGGEGLAAFKAAQQFAQENPGISVRFFAVNIDTVTGEETPLTGAFQATTEGRVDGIMNDPMTDAPFAPPDLESFTRKLGFVYKPAP